MDPLPCLWIPVGFPDVVGRLKLRWELGWRARGPECFAEPGELPAPGSRFRIPPAPIQPAPTR